MRRILSPKGVTYKVNSAIVSYREPYKEFEATLETVILERGFMRKSMRKTAVYLHKPAFVDWPMLSDAYDGDEDRGFTRMKITNSHLLIYTPIFISHRRYAGTELQVFCMLRLLQSLLKGGIVMMGQATIKVKDGKLLRVDIHYDKRVDRVEVTGDFFIYPEEALEDIENALVGIDVNEDEDTIVDLVRRIVVEKRIEMIGVSPEAIARAIKEGLR